MNILLELNELSLLPPPLLQVAFPPVSFNKSRTLDDFRINVQCNGITNTTGIKITNNFVKGILARKKLLHVA